jgi:DNA-binding NarL/FixJ family response regulator
MERMIVQVLIVDDQVSFRQVARAAIEMTAGFEVAGEVETGEASVEAVRALRPDLVLMDVRLSCIDGLEATRRIRAATGEKGPVVLLLSACEPAYYAAWAAECGASASMCKGEFGPEALSSAWIAAGRSLT